MTSISNLVSVQLLYICQTLSNLMKLIVVNEWNV